ncbi:hypothetical protein [Geodermatophilus sp. SYSU D00696]
MIAAVAGAQVRRVARCLLRVGTLALATSSVGVALVGAVFTSPQGLLVALVFGAVGWAVAVSIGRLADSLDDRGGRAARPLSSGLPVATGAALFVPFCTGVRELGAVGAYLVLALVGLLSVRGTLWIHRLGTGVGPAAPGAREPLEEDTATACPPRELLRTLSLDDLVAEWRATGANVDRSSTGHRHAVVRWREAVLEEIRRRDPAGFDAWLFAGAADPPEDHLRTVADDPAPRPDESTR